MFVKNAVSDRLDVKPDISIAEVRAIINCNANPTTTKVHLIESLADALMMSFAEGAVIFLNVIPLNKINCNNSSNKYITILKTLKIAFISFCIIVQHNAKEF